MDAQFWLQRWTEGRIGFHQERPTPLLERHWDSIGARAGSTVLVPLAGKSRDMDWLAAHGHRVIGVELSPLAVQQFFAERGIEPEVHTDADGIHHRAGAIDLIQGDAFNLGDALLASCDAVYDRAALIALPPDMRQRYASDLYRRLQPGCRGLLITLTYPESEKAGPPFSIDTAEVARLFSSHWARDLLQCKDILADQPGFQADGVTALTTSAWRLLRLDA